jgi:hypothetical protein
MSSIRPRKFIGQKMMSIVDSLPMDLAVVLEKGTDAVFYRIGGNVAAGYIEDVSWVNFWTMEETTKSLGKEITRDEFLKTKVFPFPIQQGGEGPNKYSVYKAQFKDKKSL